MYGVIDYAGLFPPAELSLGKAITNYYNYLNSPDSMMLSKFIIPASLLNSVPPALNEKILSVNGSFAVIISNTSEDIENIISSINKTLIKALEIKPGVNLDNLLDKIILIKNEINKNIEIFIESSINPDNELIEEIKVLRKNGINAGYKLRTGGLTPDAFPSPEIIASVIKSCSENGIPFKATAGLHHPFTHFNSDVNSRMYGFINIFSAGMFTVKYHPDEKELADIITDENPGNFFFEDKLSHKKYELSSDEIRNSRKNYFISFGSCSFNEPLEDLRKLKLL
jgi:hypothetical protein